MHLGGKTIFSDRTFAYFAGARRHDTDRAWFDKHKKDYEEFVAVPFTLLLSEIRDALAPSLPGVNFSGKKLSKPLRRQMPGSEEPLIRTNATVFLQEPATSMFESNPGIYLSIGATDEDNVCGVGLYQPSSRQMHRLRSGFVTGFAVIDACLKEKQLRKSWGTLAGDKYTRFPKDFDETDAAAPYLWHKQFFLSKSFDQADVTKKSFTKGLVADMVAAVPFLRWTRATVGVYHRPPSTVTS